MFINHYDSVIVVDNVIARTECFILHDDPEGGHSQKGLFSGKVVAIIKSADTSYLTRVATRFLLNDKKCKILEQLDLQQITYEADDNDKLFFELAKIITASKWTIWRDVNNMLKEGKNKKEILEYLKQMAVIVEVSK